MDLREPEPAAGGAEVPPAGKEAADANDHGSKKPENTKDDPPPQHDLAGRDGDGDAPPTVPGTPQTPLALSMLPPVTPVGSMPAPRSGTSVQLPGRKNEMSMVTVTKVKVHPGTGSGSQSGNSEKPAEMILCKPCTKPYDPEQFSRQRRKDHCWDCDPKARILLFPLATTVSLFRVA